MLHAWKSLMAHMHADMQRPDPSLDDRRVPTWLAGADCNGTEATLADCPGVALENNTQACGLRNTLVVSCTNDGASGAVLPL